MTGLLEKRIGCCMVTDSSELIEIWTDSIFDQIIIKLIMSDSIVFYYCILLYKLHLFGIYIVSTCESNKIQCMSLFDRLMTNELMARFNLKGGKQKLSFQASPVFRAVLGKYDFIKSILLYCCIIIGERTS